MKKALILTLSLVCAALAGFSQKYGYCNSAELLLGMEDVKQADSQLKAYQTQLTNKGKEMVTALQTKAAELERKNEQGTISPKEYQEQGAKLQEEQQKIAEYEQQVYDDLAKKREELYKPIFDKVNEAIKAVAKENGFSMVFDLDKGVLLHADESLDVTKLVKAKLGIQ